MGKYFVVNPDVSSVSNEALLESLKIQESIMLEGDTTRRAVSKERLKGEENLKHVDGRVIVKVDLKGKNSYRFENGTEIRLEREYNNFNRRETQPVNAIVISAAYIPSGSEILISHNGLHDSNKIFDYEPLSGQENESDVKYFSLPEYECFAWKAPDGMKPLKNFEFGLRIFKPYGGTLVGVDPDLMVDVLYVTTGELAGNVVNVLKASDYQIIYQGEDGREKYLIRFRHSNEPDFEREEVICVNHELTDKVNNGQLLVGYEIKDAKKFTDGKDA